MIPLLEVRIGLFPGRWMLNAYPGTTVVIPYKKGDLVKIVKDDYLGKVPESGLKVSENAVFFLSDVNFKSKIGISPQRAVSRSGSYDGSRKVLTIVDFSLPQDETDYVQQYSYS
jgi:hypothetical protein